MVETERILVPQVVEESQGFGAVLEHLKADSQNRASRAGWNGKNIYIQLQTPDEHSKMTLPYLYIVTTNVESDAVNPPRGCCPWLASQTDMLCEDWVLICLR